MSVDASDDPTRPTIFLELTQAEAAALERLITDEIRFRDGRAPLKQQSTDRKPLQSVQDKIQEAWSDEGIRSALMEDAIIEDGYDPDAPMGRTDD